MCFDAFLYVILVIIHNHPMSYISEQKNTTAKKGKIKINVFAITPPKI